MGLIAWFKEKIKMDNRKLIEEIISTIESEFGNSNHTEYKCNNGSVIYTDVGYVESWFKEYKDILRERYCK